MLSGDVLQSGGTECDDVTPVEHDSQHGDDSDDVDDEKDDDSDDAVDAADEDAASRTINHDSYSSSEADIDSRGTGMYCSVIAYLYVFVCKQ